MTGALIILLVTICVGLVLYVYDLRYRRKQGSDTVEVDSKAPTPPEEDHGEICCGKHLICEKPLTPKIGEEIVYYDDEELDRFAGRSDDGYSSDEIEEIRDVMLTLLPEDIPGWIRSIQLRGIALPTPLRDELFLLLECN